jgi:hypothetical protein
MKKFIKFCGLFLTILITVNCSVFGEEIKENSIALRRTYAAENENIDKQNKFSNVNEVALNKRWIIKLNKQVDINSVSKESVYVTDSSNNKVDIELSFNRKKDSIIVKPINEYKKGEKYHIHITDKIKAVDGTRLKQISQMEFEITETEKRDLWIEEDNTVCRSKKISGDIHIVGNNTRLENTDIKGTLYIDPGEGGNAYLENVTAGKVKVLSGGENSIHFYNVDAETLNIDSDSKVRVEAKGKTRIGKTIVQTYSVLDNVSGSFGEVIVTITEDENGNKKQEIELRGIFTEPVVLETSAKLKTGENTVIPKVEIAPQNNGALVELQGQFKQVHVNGQANVNILDDTRITERLRVTESANINADKKSIVVKTEISTRNRNDEVNLSGKFSTVEVNRPVSLNLKGSKVNRIISNAKADLNIDKNSQVSELCTYNNMNIVGKENINKIIDNEEEHTTSNGSRRSEGGNSKTPKDKTPPNIAADTSFSADDTSFVITGTTSDYASSITKVNVKGGNLPAEGIDITSTNLILTDKSIEILVGSGSNKVDIKTAGDYTIAVYAYGYKLQTIVQNMKAGKAALIEISQQPVPGEIGKAFSNQPIIKLLDSKGNLCSTGVSVSTVVTASVKGDTGKWEMGGTVKKQGEEGIVSFDNLTCTSTWQGNGRMTFAAADDNEVIKDSEAFELPKVFYGGDGTEGNPYKIKDAYGLNAVRNGLDKCYELIDDIDLKGYNLWEPIGEDGEKTFTGRLNGNNHIITNLRINNLGDSYAGLFGRIKGIIINIGMIDVEVSAYDMVGGLVGYAENSIISNCYCTGKISARYKAGGLVGFVQNSIVNNCYTDIDISTMREYEKDDPGWYVGGLIGRAQYSTKIKNCYSSGDISIKADRVGGLIGSECGEVQVTNCYSTVNVYGNSKVGGVVGEISNSEISKCYSYGNVSGKSKVGGVIGSAENEEYISSCVALNPNITRINGSEASFGRIVGALEDPRTLSNNYAYENVVFKGIDHEIQSDASGNDGKDISLSKLKMKNTYIDSSILGWKDFDEVWNMIDGSTYPTLRGVTLKEGEDLALPCFDGKGTKAVGGAEKEGTINVDIDLDEKGKVYYIFVPKDSYAPTVEQVKAGDNYEGVNVAAYKNVNITQPGEISKSIVEELNPGEYYDIYLAAEDINGNTQHEVTKLPNIKASKCPEPIKGVTGEYRYIQNSSGGFFVRVILKNLPNTMGKLEIKTAFDGINYESYRDITIENNEAIIDDLWGEFTKPTIIIRVKKSNEPTGKESEPILLVPYEDGSSINPYFIRTAEDLNAVRGKVEGYENWGLDKYYKLINDIDLKDYGEWTPIGKDEERFAGYFDGNGHIIKNVNMQKEADNIGLFSITSKEAVIENLGLINIDIKGNHYVGGLVGKNHGNIRNCYTKGKVSGSAYLGGLAGKNSFEVIGNDIFYGVITNSYSYAEVNGNEYVGGLVGYNESNINNCYAGGNINGNYYVGGLIGENWNDINNCYASGNINGNKYVGGLIGINMRDIKNCYSTGDVNGKNRIGGLVGENSSSISQCYSTGNITGYDYIGGLTGYNTGEISNCAAINSTIQRNNDSEGVNFGRIDGYIEWGEVLNNYVYKNMALRGIDYIPSDDCNGKDGKQLDLAEFAREYTYSCILNWHDFYYAWDIQEGGGFPTLKGLTGQEYPGSSKYDLEVPKFINGTPKISIQNDGDLKLIVSLNEKGIVYYAIDFEGSYSPSAQALKEGVNNGGMNATTSGSITIKEPLTCVKKTIKDLNPGEIYELYFVAEDIEGNLQSEVIKITEVKIPLNEKSKPVVEPMVEPSPARIEGVTGEYKNEDDGTATIRLNNVPEDRGDIEYKIALDGINFGEYSDLEVSDNKAVILGEVNVTTSSAIVIRVKEDGEVPAGEESEPITLKESKSISEEANATASSAIAIRVKEDEEE